MKLKQRISALLIAIIRLERRIDPYFREGFDRVLRPAIERVVQAWINARRPNMGLSIAEERELPGESASAAKITECMAQFLRMSYPSGYVERAGNTKTYGVVRGEFTVLPDLPNHLRHGVLAEPRSYRAWVRFSGPGPFNPPDIDDFGILSMGVKLMGVAGPKLSDDERYTQDLFGLSSPTFTTPNVIENAKAQQALVDGAPAFYFINPLDPHLADGIMQALYSKTHTNPLAPQYYSCVAYLLGKGQAIHYSFRPAAPIAGWVPKRPSANYLREAMAQTLAKQDVAFDVLVQLQTDPHRMPIEDAGVRWPERESPFVPVARLRIPQQTFDSPAQLRFAGNLSFNPWHSLAEHRPLGNLNRARRAMYMQLSQIRQHANHEQRIEPTGDEQFDGDIITFSNTKEQGSKNFS